MKIIAGISASVFAALTAVGQTIAISGVVSNQKGQPVPFAFVRDAQHSYATYADSAGAFNLKADPLSALRIIANGYREGTVKVNNQSNINVVLSLGTDIGSVPSIKAGEIAETGTFLRARQQMVIANAVGAGGGTDITVVRAGFALEPTRGSFYQFDDWVPGYGVDKEDKLVIEPSNMYNYDKMTGNIMYTNDGRSLAGVSPTNIKSFSLYDKNGHAHVFENAPGIKGVPFVEILLNTPKIRIYKKINTKLSRADFHTDGILEVGKRYDEYQDATSYYCVNGADGKPKQISLKKKVIKELFAGEADAFISSQGSREVNDDYIRDLGHSLNQ